MKEDPNKFYAFIESEEEAITKLHDKYFDLVWYARKSPDIQNKKAQSNIKRIEREYPKEVNDIISEDGYWHHGFNSGMLAALRLFDYPLGIQEGLEEFPFLDT